MLAIFPIKNSTAPKPPQTKGKWKIRTPKIQFKKLILISLQKFVYPQMFRINSKPQQDDEAKKIVFRNLNLLCDLFQFKILFSPKNTAKRKRQKSILQ